MRSLINSDKKKKRTKNAMTIGALGLVCIAFLMFGTSPHPDKVAKETAPVETSAPTARFYPFRIHGQEGAILYQIELALTREEQLIGLMDRPHLDNDRGMLFVFPEIKDVSFWMHRTLIPLDLLYITDEGVINHIHPMAQPHDETPLPSKGGAVRAVLEIPGGQAAAKGIQIGDTVDTDLLKKEPQS